MKITDVKIEVVRRTLPDTGLDSDLGRFSGDVEQGILRILTDEGIEGNCFVGDFRGGGHGQFGPILNVLKPEILGRDPFERERLWSRLPILSGQARPDYERLGSCGCGAVGHRGQGRRSSRVQAARRQPRRDRGLRHLPASTRDVAGLLRRGASDTRRRIPRLQDTPGRHGHPLRLRDDGRGEGRRWRRYGAYARPEQRLRLSQGVGRGKRGGRPRILLVRGPCPAPRIRQHRRTQQASPHSNLYERQARKPVPDRLPLHPSECAEACARHCSESWASPA